MEVISKAYKTNNIPYFYLIKASFKKYQLCIIISK